MIRQAGRMRHGLLRRSRAAGGVSGRAETGNRVLPLPSPKMRAGKDG
jgi:hypothetical protein